MTFNHLQKERIPNANENKQSMQSKEHMVFEAKRARAHFTKELEDKINVKCAQPTYPLEVPTAGLVGLLRIILSDYD